jgi:putative DNA primase/helicase
MSAQLNGQPTTGFTRLQEILGAKITDKVSDWLDLEFYNCGFGHNSDGGIGHNSSIQRNDALRYTDIGNAEKFVETYGDQVRYCHELAEWISWNNKKWTIGDKVSVERMAESTIRAFEKEAEHILDIRDRDAFFDWIKRSGNRSHIKAMYEQAQHRLNIDHGKLDADLDVINVNGKMIDLRTGNARPIEQSDLSTKSMGVVYDTEAQCPQFNEFLDQIMNGSAELINYLQRAVGYTLTGHTSEQCLFIAHGIGANGKSVFLNLIKKLMGDYAMTTPMASLVSLKTNSGASNDIARLRGARFVSASEGEANQKLKVALIKQLTGGDTIASRFLFREYFEFTPNFSMWIATNFKLKVSSDDQTIWSIWSYQSNLKLT